MSCFLVCFFSLVSPSSFLPPSKVRHVRAGKHECSAVQTRCVKHLNHQLLSIKHRVHPFVSLFFARDTRGLARSKILYSRSKAQEVHTLVTYPPVWHMPCMQAWRHNTIYISSSQMMYIQLIVQKAHNLKKTLCGSGILYYCTYSMYYGTTYFIYIKARNRPSHSPAAAARYIV